MLNARTCAALSTMVMAAVLLSAPAASAQNRNAREQAARDQQMVADHYRQEAEAQGATAATTGRPFSYDFSDLEHPNPVDYGAALAATREAMALMREAEDGQRALESDPRYHAWMNGSWNFYQDRASAGPGQHCAATFWSKDGIITVKGPDELYTGATLFFSSEGLPKPARDQDIPITLTQNQEPPARITVRSMARTPGSAETGTIAIVVPNIEGALAGMLDQQEFAIAIEGREVFRMAWKDGLAAREQLRRCVSQRRS